MAPMMMVMVVHVVVRTTAVVVRMFPAVPPLAFHLLPKLVRALLSLQGSAATVAFLLP